MDYCKRYVRVAWTRKSAGRVLFTRLRCKSWDCPYCAKANQRMWRAFLGGQLPVVSDEWWHVTVTAHSRMRQQDASYKNLQTGIDRLMKRVRRVFGKVEYVRVFESHLKSEALHAHMLISGLSEFVVPGCHKNLQPGFLAVTERTGHTGTWSVRTWLKKAAQEVQIGYQADVRRCEDGRAVFYITKYLTKAGQAINVKGLRHVSTSNRVGSPGIESNDTWQVGSHITGMDVDEQEILVDMQTGEKIKSEVLRAMGVYPPDVK